VDSNSAWNAEPSPNTVLEEPIIRLLMRRDGVDVAVLKRLVATAHTRSSYTAATAHALKRIQERE
jgi:hypothetical protein